MPGLMPGFMRGIQERKLIVVACKRCLRDVPAGVWEFPFQSIVVACPLCRKQRLYLPSEVFLGRESIKSEIALSAKRYIEDTYSTRLKVIPLDELNSTQRVSYARLSS
jgi:hypothetical protein